jgi:hypothetical protein
MDTHVYQCFGDYWNGLADKPEGWGAHLDASCAYHTEVKKRQGCQMVCVQTKPPVWVHFGSPLNGKILMYFMIMGYTLWPFAFFHGNFEYVAAIR